MRITGVVLAAGRSSRMGQNKLLLLYRDHTLLEEVLEQLSRSAVDDILVVTGFDRRRIEDLVAGFRNHRIRSVHNRNYKYGRAESIKCAIEHLKGQSDAALFMVGDKPTIATPLIDKAIEKFKRQKPGILYIRTPEGRGHPILFSGHLFDEMMTWTGDKATEEFIEKHRDEVAELKDQATQWDINTMEDYRKLLHQGYPLHDRERS